jgi:hypothetical protein
MANEFTRNIQDASVNPTTTTFALPSAAGSTTSSYFDLGADVQKPESVQLRLSVPALTDAMVGSGETITYIWETSATSNFSTIAREISRQVMTGAGSGISAVVLRTRVPPDCERYVRAKATTGASTGDASSISGTVQARF